MEKALDTLAILYARFEKVSRDLGEVGRQFDKEFMELQDAWENHKQAQRTLKIASRRVHDSRMDYHRLSGSYEVAEKDLNEELGCTRELVGDAAAATIALSCGTNDWDNSELRYLQDALLLVDSLLFWLKAQAQRFFQSCFDGLVMGNLS